MRQESVQTLSYTLFFYFTMLLTGVHAEGTAQLMPLSGGSSCISYVQGNDGKGKEGANYGRPWYDLIYVHIADPTTEMLYVGFTRKLPTSKDVYVQIINPKGVVVYQAKVAASTKDAGYIPDDGTAAYVGPTQIGGAGGYKAVEITPKYTGDYTIQFNVGHETSAQPWETKYFIHPFDVTVADVSNPSSPVAIPGRLFSYKWHLNTNSGSNQACMDFYTYTPDSLVVRMDMNGIQAYGYSVSFNSHGTFNTGDIAADRQSTSTISVAVPEYKVFLNEPDATAYPTGTPGRVTYLNVQGCQTDSTYCFEVNTTKPGELNVYVDLDGTGAYESGGKDVYFPYYTSETGIICVPWDGLDGYGNPVGDSVSGSVAVEFLAGIVHFPIWDPETHNNGFDAAIVRPSGLANPKMYFDNSLTPIGTINLSGCSSGCNTWSSNKGNNIMVNTWVNTITSTDTASFTILSHCGAEAVNDTACTQIGSTVQISILSNDTPGDVPLSMLEVSLILSDLAHGSMSYSDYYQLVTYTPASDSSEIAVRYTLCDTSAGYIPLCDTATIHINVLSSCAAVAILTPLEVNLRGQFSQGYTRLHWHLPKGIRYKHVQIDRSTDGKIFHHIGNVKGRAIKHGWRDYDPTLAGAAMVAYRIVATTTSGMQLRSPTINLNTLIDPPLRLDIRPSHPSETLHISYQAAGPGLLQVLDPTGRILHQEEVPPAPLTKHKAISLNYPVQGLYVVALKQDFHQVSRRFLIK